MAHQLAIGLNQVIGRNSPYVLGMLSELGRAVLP